MFTLLHFPYYWGAMLALAGGAELSRLDAKIEASLQIQVGDREADVLAILGEPTRRWDVALWPFVNSKTWAYGTTLNVESIVNRDGWLPNPVPIRFRILGADDDDLVFRWKGGKVVSVTRPVRASGVR